MNNVSLSAQAEAWWVNLHQIRLLGKTFPPFSVCGCSFVKSVLLSDDSDSCVPEDSMSVHCHLQTHPPRCTHTYIAKLLWLRTSILEMSYLSSGLESAVYYLCDLGQVLWSL